MGQLPAKDVLDSLNAVDASAGLVGVAEVRVELLQHARLLHVHHEVAGLGVVEPATGAIEISFGHQAAQWAEGVVGDGLLQGRQAPVLVAGDERESTVGDCPQKST